MALVLPTRWPVLGRAAAWQAHRAGWFAATLLTAFLAAHDPARAADTAPAQQGDDVVQLLSRIQQAARKQDYAGVFMYQQGEMIQSSRLVHVLDGTGERERLEILDGQPREYLRHNEDVQCLIPERKTVLLERRRGDRFPGLLLGDPANLTEHYKIRTESALHRVAGRECRLITIEPLDKLRYGYRLCADVETNLLLKAQTLNAARGVVEQVSFTSLRLGAEVDPQSLTSRWNTRDWKVLEPSMKPVDLGGARLAHSGAQGLFRGDAGGALDGARRDGQPDGAVRRPGGHLGLHRAVRQPARPSSAPWRGTAGIDYCLWHAHRRFLADCRG